ncbi:MAG TPA: DUF6429 family protein [Candidatus Angelobacter sp.]|jgi:hypothetical protein|nr:DUF6429 family protein [Candidatus Angelobacter sp.]
MEYDEDKVDEVVLALLQLTRCGEARAWKGQDWATLDRLYEKGLIFDPKNKSKSVMLTEEGEQRSRELFEKYFAKPRPNGNDRQ